MPDLTTLDDLDGSALTEAQILAILNQIDLDVLNLLRDGKLAAARYGLPQSTHGTMDRASGLMALLAAREKYEALLRSLPSWEASQAEDCCAE